MLTFIRLEPTLVYSVWHPTKDYDPNRPVEGMYFLRTFPPKVHSLPPAEIQESDIESMQKCIDSIRSHHQFCYGSSGHEKREWWEHWVSKVIQNHNYSQRDINKLI